MLRSYWQLATGTGNWVGGPMQGTPVLSHLPVDPAKLAISGNGQLAHGRDTARALMVDKNAKIPE